VFFAVLAAFTFQRLHLSAFHAKPVSFACGHGACAAHLGRRPGLDGERQRLLALPARATAPSRTFWAATMGAPSRRSSWRSRVLAYTITTKSVASPRSACGILPRWFVTPFLIFASSSSRDQHLDMYSSGVTLQALGVPVKRWGGHPGHGVCAAVTASSCSTELLR